MSLTYYVILAVLSVAAVVPWLLMLLGVAEVRFRWAAPVPPLLLTGGELLEAETEVPLLACVRRLKTIHEAIVVDGAEQWSIYMHTNIFRGDGVEALTAKLRELQKDEA